MMLFGRHSHGLWDSWSGSGMCRNLRGLGDSLAATAGDIGKSWNSCKRWSSAGYIFRVSVWRLFI